MGEAREGLVSSAVWKYGCGCYSAGNKGEGQSHALGFTG
jgi:hypothetical protein